MATKKGNKFLNFIGLGPADEPIEEESYYEEEETPVANMRRENYIPNRASSYQREDVREQDFGYDNSYSSYQEEYQQPSQSPVNTTSFGASKVVNHPSISSRHRTMIYQLESYEDSKDVIDDLLEGHSVLINLEKQDLSEAQRIIDTLIGACYAINATIKRAAVQTYLLAPETVEVAGTYVDESGSFVGDAHH